MSDPKPFVFEPSAEAKRTAPATERNRDAITHVLKRCLPPQGTVLEIASGTGEHIIHFAAQFPHLDWQPSDSDPLALASIAAWRAESGGDNLLVPVEVDAAAAWKVPDISAILCINMVHISPWEATKGLMRNAGRLLPKGGLLYVYGPFHQQNRPTAPSNEEFDRNLKSRNSQWGLRFVEDVAQEASLHALHLDQIIEMPANNLSLLFRA
ncbi:MAG: SAM-dependent methyltransferase [Sphingopyxis sp.]|nr:SAM-dependent methyltransferase [Sphingopyxis sp.]